MRHVLIFVLLAVFCVPCARSSDLSKQEREIDVIVDFLTDQLGPAEKRGPYNFDQNLVTTVGFPDKTVPKEAVGKVPASLIADFLRVNAQPSHLPQALLKKYPIYVLSDKEYAKNFPNDTDLDKDWENYYKKFPHSGGLYSLSHVGFSKDGFYAMLFFGHLYASLVDTDDLYVLKWDPKSGHWKVTGVRFNLGEA